jgi:L-ascorbate metabolism protein UlaG (beta-lactamase superfamily)
MTILSLTRVARFVSRPWAALAQWPPFKYGRIQIADLWRPVAPAPLRPEPSQWPQDRITAAWLGHATVLINFFGVMILTDPVLFTRAGLGVHPFIIGPKRYVAPALTLAELPAIDLILLSHAHMDHFDRITLRRLRAGPAVITAQATADLLRGTRLQARVTELAWGEKTQLRFDRLAQTADDAIEIEAFEVNHWGARMRTDVYRGYNGYIIRRGGAAILFAGDTAMTTLFRKVRGQGAPLRGGTFDLALMPIGAYNPWRRAHCNPEQAVEMADDAGARFILPLHHQTFRLSEEPLDEPVQRLEKALAHAPERLALRRIGETFEVPGARPA